MMQILTVVDSEAADPACAHGSCHCRQTDQTDSRDRDHTDQIRHCFMKIYAEHDPRCTAPHSTGGFYLSRIYS